MGAVPLGKAAFRILIAMLSLATVLGAASFARAEVKPKNAGLPGASRQRPREADRGLENEGAERRDRAEDWERAHRDRSGRLRPDLYRKGVRDFESLSTSSAWVQPPATPGAPSAQITPVPPPARWEQVGPAPLSIDPWPGAVDYNAIFQGQTPDAGMVTDLAIDPRGTTDSVVYATFNDGGLWKTTTGGSSWTPLTDDMPSQSMGAVALDPSNPDIVYAGTGNPDNNGYFSGVGIYRSADGGQTWSHRGTALLGGKAIFRMAVLSSGVLLVGTNQGLYRSVDGGLHFGDNAPNFDNDLPVIDAECTTDVYGRDQCITDLHVDTASPNTVYAAVFGGGILKSTDGGATFPTNLFDNAGSPPAGFGRISFSQSRNPNNQTIYASVGKDISPDAYAGLYKSTNAGGSWTKMTAADALPADTNYDGQGSSITCQCNYDLTVGVDPQNASRVYVGFQELSLSTDGAASFGSAPVTRSQVHWDNHALVFSPPAHWGGNTTSRVWIGTDGGTSTSTDMGTTWTNVNNGVSTQLFREIDIGRGASNNAYTYGGTQDTGTEEHRPTFGTREWHLGIDGDGGRLAVDPANPQIAFGTDNGTLIATSDAGTTWGGSGYVNSYAWDRLATTNVYATSVGSSVFRPGTQVYYSNNTGGSFFLMHTFSSAVHSLSTTKASSQILWASLDNGQVGRTGNALAGGASTWSVNTVTGAPTGVPSRIYGDPLDGNTAVVVYGGFCGGACAAGARTKHVFRTTNAGATWTDISGTDGGSQNVPDLPVNGVALDETVAPSEIIIADDAGVLVSDDNGATWQKLGSGLPTVNVTSLALDNSVSPRLLRVGTFGRSALELRSRPAGPPANDPFASPTTSSGTPGFSFALTNVGATKEAGEPNHAGNTGGASIWASWTPSASGTATIDTSGSAFDTILGVYTGSDVANLTRVASNDDDLPNLTSRVVFHVHKGTNYRIAVDGYNPSGTVPEEGAVSLHATVAATPRVQSDFNNDGYADLAVGVPNAAPGGIADAGAVNVVMGSASGLTSTGAKQFTQSQTGGTAENGDLFGSALVSGDFNHDGYDDLAIGAPGEDSGANTDMGIVNIVYGSASGLTSAGAQQLSQGSAGGTSESNDRFGAALATGDVNGDGYDDLVAGAPGETLGTQTTAGAVNLLRGSAGGLTSAGAAQFNQSQSGGGYETGDEFGSAVAIGSFDGDAYADLAVGAPGETYGSASAAGVINLLSGTSSGLTSTGARQLTQAQAAGTVESGDRFGDALAAGDFNDDGLADLAIGTPAEAVGSLTLSGVVNMLNGGASGLTSTGAKQLTQSAVGGNSEAGDRFGAAVAAGDVNNDGYADLAVGSPDEAVGSLTGAGLVNVVRGSASGLTTTGAQQLTQTQAAGNAETDDRFGAALVWGDVNKDGFADVIAGSPGETANGAAAAGVVNVARGSASGTTSTGAQQLTRSNAAGTLHAGDRFGAAVG